MGLYPLNGVGVDKLLTICGQFSLLPFYAVQRVGNVEFIVYDVIKYRTHIRYSFASGFRSIIRARACSRVTASPTSAARLSTRPTNASYSARKSETVLLMFVGSPF